MRRSRESRVQELITSLRAMNADIIGLQEVWDPDSESAIISGLADMYPHVYVPHRGRKRLSGTATGQMLLSKHEIIDCMFVEFEQSQYAQSLVCAGFYSVGLNIDITGSAGSTRTRVFGIHAQAYPYARTRQHNIQQFVYGKDGIAAYRAKNPSDLVISLGDFNVNFVGSEADALYSAMCDAQMHHIVPAMCSGDGDNGNNLCALPMSGNRHICDLDFIFASISNPDGKTTSEARYQYSSISDHFPLLAIVPLSSNAFAGRSRFVEPPNFTNAWPENVQILFMLLLITLIIVAVIIRKNTAGGGPLKSIRLADSSSGNVGEL